MLPIVGGLALGGLGALGAFGGGGGGGRRGLKLPPQYEEAMNELLKRGKAPVSYPTQQIAPLSELERLGIEKGRQFVESTDVTDVDRASEIYRAIGAPGDILERPEVRGMIGKTTEEGNLMLNRLGRGMVTRGTFASSSGRDILGRGVTSIQERIASSLSAYLSEAEQRRLSAAGGLERTGVAKEGTALQKVSTAVNLGSLTRSIEQAIKDAQFKKVISDIQMRYQIQPQALASVMGESVVPVGGQEPSMFEQISPLIQTLLGAAINKQS